MVVLSRKVINYTPINNKYLLEQLRHEVECQGLNVTRSNDDASGEVQVDISKYFSQKGAMEEESVAGVVCLRGGMIPVAKWKEIVWNCLYQMKNSPLSLASSPVLQDLVTDLEDENIETNADSNFNHNPIPMIHLSLPIQTALRLCGIRGQTSMKRLLNDGILTSISNRMIKNEDETVLVTVFGSVNPEKDLQLDGEERVYSQNVNLAIRKIESEGLRMNWIFTRYHREINKLLQRFNVLMSRKEDGILLLIGLEEDLVEEAVRQVQKLLNTGHVFSLRFRQNTIKYEADNTLDDYLKQVCSLEGGVEVRVDISGSGSSIGSIHFVGEYSSIRQALNMFEYSGDCILSYQPQIHYRLIDNEEVREFVSGKKDGKLIKIMKETGVCMSVRVLGSKDETETKAGLIEFELMTGTEVGAVLVALEMLMGEFPAECSFFLEESYHKRLIGHGGKNIQKIMKKHAVYIKFLTMDEAIEMEGIDVNYCYSDYLASRLPNVLVRTPAKNSEALAYAKIDILEMAEELTNDLDVIHLSWPMDTLIEATKNQRKALLDIIDNFGDTVLVSLNRGEGEQAEDDELIQFEFTGPVHTLYEIQMEILSLSWLTNHTSIFTPTSLPSPNLSSTTSTTSSTLSACDPEKLRPWNTSLFLTPNLSSLLTSAAATPVLLGCPYSLPTSPKLSTIEGFNSCVGAQLKNKEKKKGPWELNFPRQSLMTVDCARIGRQDEMSEQMDWRAIIAESFRRRASLIINN